MATIEQMRKWVDFQAFADVQAASHARWLEFGEIQALVLYALATARLGDTVAAQQALSACELDLTALDVHTRVDLAAVRILCGHWTQASDDLNRVLQECPDHALAMARLAFVCLAQGDHDEAERLYSASLAKEPGRPGVWLGLVRLCVRLKRWHDAQQVIDQARKAANKHWSDHDSPFPALLERELNIAQLHVWAAEKDLARAEAWLAQERHSAIAAAHQSDETRNEFDGKEREQKWVEYVRAYAWSLTAQDAHDEADQVLRDALRLSPADLGLLTQRAELAVSRGFQGQAIGLLRRAIRVSESNEEDLATQVGLYVQLAEAYRFERAAEKLKAAKRAHELAGRFIADEQTNQPKARSLWWAAQCVLASAQSAAGNFECAEQLFQAVLAENEFHEKALLGLGQQALQQGRLEQAIAHFERLKEVDPVGGVSSLISARQIPDDIETLIRVETLARKPSFEGSERASLLFPVALAWERHGDFARAFETVDRANVLNRKHLRYDPDDHRQRCARIRAAFCTTLYRHRAACGYRGEGASKPVFVVGMPRSGTTLVEQILAGHSLIYGAGEVGVMGGVQQGLNRWERITGSGRSFPDCVDDLTPEISHELALNLLSELSELAAETKPNARFVVDKMPHNFENIGFIKFLFPEARIISVRRDPRDIAISNYFTDFAAKHGGMGFAYDLEWIGRQLADHNLLMHHWHQLFPEQILEVQYEEVVEDTEGMARKMLDYIGVAWEPQVLAFNELDRPVKTASVWQVRQPIYKSSKAKWERYKDQIGSLIKGTNAKITWEPIEMVTLPEPGWLTQGVGQYKAGDLDSAEYTLKKLLHHIPEHAAAKAVIGLIYLRKGHVKDGVALLEQALQRCPWNQRWREDLVKALSMAGDNEKAESVRQGRWPERRGRPHSDERDGYACMASEALDCQFDDGLDDDPNWARLQTSVAFK